MAAPPKLNDIIWTEASLTALPSGQKHRNVLYSLQGRPELVGVGKSTGKFGSISKINSEILRLQAERIAKKPAEPQQIPQTVVNVPVEPVVEETAVKEPAVEEPAVEEPAVEETAVEETAVEETAVEPSTQIPLSELIYKDIDTWDDDKLLQYDITNPIPQEWIERRDEEYGLYPNISDPNFAARLAKKTEFYELRSEPVAEDSCQKAAGEFSTTSIQRLVARFLHPDTPYNGALLYHGVGVGKTCSAVTVAETFLETMPYNKVYIIAPQAIAEGFRRTIFDVNRLVGTSPAEYALTKELWKSPQCTGMTYVRLADMANNPDKEEIAKEVDKLVKKRYQIMGYLRFANWVNDRFKEIPDTITEQAREDRKIAIMRELFADHLLIIDEAHNLRDADPGEEAMGDEAIADGTGAEGVAADEVKRARLTERAEGKRLTPVLQNILSVADGLRLMLMTATPMYNTAPEIVFLLNLLTLNDTKDDSLRLEVPQVFQADGQFKPGGAALLSRLIKRYVSYMRGENPNTFPLRLTPAESNSNIFIDSEYPKYSIARKEMKKGKKELVGHVNWGGNDKNIMKRLPLWIHKIGGTWVGDNLRGYLKKYHTQAVNESDRGTEISDFILDRTMQIGNIYYKNGTYGRDGWRNYFKEIVTTIRSTKVKQFTWNNVDTESIQEIFGAENLANYAPKIAAIVDCIERGEGISFVYSRYIPAGALPIAIALELRGWVRVLADGTPAPLLLQEGAVPKATKYYILLTSDDGLSPNFPGLIRHATTFKNMDEVNGSKVKAIIGSQVASEGLDLKCIRQIHLLDGWYHLNRIEQIEGRGVRFCSHVELPLEKRNCLIYLHAVDVGKYETADLYAYRLAVRKAQPIGRVSRLMKENAWDCNLNLNAVLLRGMGDRDSVDALGRRQMVPLKDEPFTSLCDFIGDPVYNNDGDVIRYECKPYSCGAESKGFGSNDSTQQEYNFRRVFLEKQQRLINYFKTETVIEVSKVIKLFYSDIPESFARIGLRNVLDNIRIHRKDGIYGTLRLVNDYIVFQPEGVTDTIIPMALRYGRAYGRMPRDYDPPRGTLLATDGLSLDKPIATTTTAATVAAPTAVDIESDEALAKIAFDKLRKWDATLTQILDKKLTGPISEMDGLLGWRWVFRFFRRLPDVKSIAYHWYMENFWSHKEQLAAFRNWLTRGIDTLRGYERDCAKVFMKENHRIELFQKDKANRISGCVIYNLSVGESGALQTYCQYGGSISQCTAVFKEDINSILGKAVDRKTDTGPYFGFLVSKQKTIIFKSVDKAKGDLKGAECANTPNLGNHQQRVRAIQDILRAASDPIAELLLADTPLETATDKKTQKARQDMLAKQFKSGNPSVRADSADPLTHITDLTLKQICPYMEFLLRYADRRAVGGSRWFLSVVDSARAGVKMT